MENNLIAMFALAMSVLGNNTVINEAVTARIMRHFTFGIDAIMNAGKTGLKANKGIVKNVYNLFFSNGYTGKMLGKVGLSGYAGNNTECLKRALLGYGICRHCFSFLTPWMPSILAWTKNDLILSSIMLGKNDIIIDPDIIPSMRFSSHGDTINPLHVYNYLRIADDNPDVEFGLWTKNMTFYREGLKMFGHKPSNIFIEFSPIAMNVIPTDKALINAKSNGIDAIFGVSSTWDNQNKALANGGHKCMCGENSCHFNCAFCYNARKRAELGMNYADRAVFISEILDGERHKE